MPHYITCEIILCTITFQILKLLTLGEFHEGQTFLHI